MDVWIPKGKKRQQFALLVLLVLHVVGISGFAIEEFRSAMTQLTPIHLCTVFVLTLWGIGKQKSSFYLTLFIVGILGWLVEWIGVHTGWLFGSYTYGSTLGAKVNGIPVLMAVNWILLLLGSHSFLKRYTQNAWLIAVCASALMTGMDVLIEPVAIQLDFWSWNGGDIPMYNYICWFCVSFVMHFIIAKQKTLAQNDLADAVFIILALFFAVMNLF